MGRNYNYPGILYVKAYTVFHSFQQLFKPEIKLTLSAFYDHLLIIKKKRISAHFYKYFKAISSFRFQIVFIYKWFAA